MKTISRQVLAQLLGSFFLLIALLSPSQSTRANENGSRAEDPVRASEFLQRNSIIFQSSEKFDFSNRTLRDQVSKKIPAEMWSLARITRALFAQEKENDENFRGANCISYALSYHLAELRSPLISMEINLRIIELGDQKEEDLPTYDGENDIDVVYEPQNSVRIPWIRLPGNFIRNPEYFERVDEKDIRPGDLIAVVETTAGYSQLPIEDERDVRVQYVNTKSEQVIHMGIHLDSQLVLQKDSPVSKEIRVIDRNSLTEAWDRRNSKNSEIEYLSLRPSKTLLEEIASVVKEINGSSDQQPK